MHERDELLEFDGKRAPLSVLPTSVLLFAPQRQSAKWSKARETVLGSPLSKAEQLL